MNMMFLFAFLGVVGSIAMLAICRRLYKNRIALAHESLAALRDTHRMMPEGFVLPISREEARMYAQDYQDVVESGVYGDDDSVLRYVRTNCRWLYDKEVFDFLFP